jgi:hypothetical protein
MGPLAPNRQAFAVPLTAIRAHVHVTLDIHGDLTSKISLHLVTTVDDLPDLYDLIVGKMFRLGIKINSGFLEYLSRRSSPNPVDIR